MRAPHIFLALLLCAVTLEWSRPETRAWLAERARPRAEKRPETVPMPQPYSEWVGDGVRMYDRALTDAEIETVRRCILQPGAASSPECVRVSFDANPWAFVEVNASPSLSNAGPTHKRMLTDDEVETVRRCILQPRVARSPECVRARFDLRHGWTYDLPFSRPIRDSSGVCYVLSSGGAQRLVIPDFWCEP